MKRSILLITALFSIAAVFSQPKKEVLLTINGAPVYASEFKQVYHKNLELVEDENQKSVDGYLDLFIDYKLKIAEAYAMGFHERELYKNEFSKYQEQLSRNYLYEDEVTKDLTREAYNRDREEIEAAHILVLSKYDDLPQDTLVAYNKIKDIRKKALEGADFTALAKQYSEEPGAAERGGYLGYFSAFSMVYPFESMAYQTNEGEISEIVRTQFGYHIIKVLDRREKGPEITVSHIMLADREGETRTFDPAERIKEVYALLQQGEAFEDLAKQYSDDKNSALKGGKLNKFGRGGLRSEKFEEVAFALKPGEVSQPVKTQFGWHIIRLDEIHAIPSFEEAEESLEKRVQNGNRKKIITNAINTKIKEKYGFKKEAPYKDFFNSYVTDSILRRQWHPGAFPKEKDKPIFTIGDKRIFFSDFATYLEERQRRMAPYKSKELLISDIYNDFEDQELRNYFRERLEKENDEYAAIINEYRNGLLIFDLMNESIWQKAKQDSLGLEAYYMENRERYMGKESIEGIIVSSTLEDTINEASAMLQANKSAEEIKTALNSEGKINAIVSSGIFEKGQRELPKAFVFKEGVSETYKENGKFVIVKVSRIVPPGIKDFQDIRGKVINDYQNELEQQWKQSLRAKFNVEVNKKVLKKVKKEIES